MPKRMHYVTYKGKRMTLYKASKLARENGDTHASYETMLYLVTQKGMTFEDAVKNPPHKRYHLIRGHLLTSSDIKRIYGVSAQTYLKRRARGIPVDRALNPSRIRKDENLVGSNPVFRAKGCTGDCFNCTLPDCMSG